MTDQVSKDFWCVYCSGSVTPDEYLASHSRGRCTGHGNVGKALRSTIQKMVKDTIAERDTDLREAAHYDRVAKSVDDPELLIEYRRRAAVLREKWGSK
jgi:hypothetical protein